MADIQQNAFMLSSATVMIGQAFVEDPFSFTPATHSVGMASEVQVNLDSSLIELLNGTAQVAVDARRTGLKAGITGNIYEMTSKNFMRSQGIVGEPSAVKTGILVAAAAAGATSIQLSGMALYADGTSAIDTVPAGSTLLLQRVNGEFDYVFPTKTTGVESVAGSVLTVPLAGNYKIPTGMSFPVGTRVWVVPEVSVGDIDADSYFAVKITGTLSNFDRPVTVVFPKVRMVKGFQVSFNETSYGSMPWEMQPVLLSKGEATGRLADVGTRRTGVVYVGAGSIGVGAPGLPPPNFTSNPTASPSSGYVGDTFTGTDGVVTNGSVVSRRWLLSTTAISTAQTAVPNSPGNLVFENTANGTGGNTVGSSAASTVLARPTIGLAGAISTNEGNSLTTSIIFTVNRSISVGAASVNWAVSGITANAADFVGAVFPSGTVNFANGEASKTIAVPVQGDTTVESDETFTITLTSPSSPYEISASTATGTIVNDDAVPAPSFTSQPSISGTVTVGQTLTGTDGTVSNGSVTGRLWKRNGVAISAAVASTYTLVTADAGTTITFHNDATGAGGSAGADSSGVGPVAAAPTFNTLTLAANIYAENSAVDTVIGGILGTTSGSTLTLIDSAGNKTKINSTNLAVGATSADFETLTPNPFSVTIRESKSGYADKDTVLSVSVTNVFEQPTLANLSFSSATWTIGTPASGAISGATAGSTIGATGLPTGVTINSAARTWSYDGTGTATSGTSVLTETLADSSNSGRTSNVSYSVAAAGGVTAVQVMGDINDSYNAAVAPIYAANQVQALPTNGWVIKVTGDGSFGTIDPTKVTVTISSPGFMDGGATTTRTRTAYGSCRLRSIYKNSDPATSTVTYISAGTNSWYVVLDNLLYTGDTITNITFAAGFYSGSSSQSLGTATYNQSVPYPEPIARPAPGTEFTRVTAATTPFEVAVIHDHAQAGKQVASVEAWMVDKNNLVGASVFSNTMVKSRWTPDLTHPSGIPAPVYALNVPSKTSGGTQLADGDAKIYYKVYPFVGVAWSSATGGSPFPTNMAPDAIPVLIDVAGNHSPIYAWVNQNGSAGASPAVQTTATDPGSAASYASASAAATALKAYNNASRTITHNDLSGGVIMLRDVAGSTEGSDTGAYGLTTVQWGSTTTWNPGSLPIEVWRAADPTTPSVLCRARWTGTSGTAIGSRGAANKVRWRGIFFDSQGKTVAVDNTIMTLQGDAATYAAATNYGIYINCKIYNSTSVSLTSGVIYKPGWSWDIRSDRKDTYLSELGTTQANFSHLVGSIGSKYWSSSAVYGGSNSNMGGCLLGVDTIIPIKPNTLASPTSVVPVTDQGILFNVRCEAIDATNPMFTIGSTNNPVKKGWGGCNLLFRRVGTTSGPMIGISNDGYLGEINNVVLQHISHDDGLDGQGDRINFAYQDQGAIQIRKYATLRYCAFGSFNNKRDTMLAPEIWSSQGTAWVTAGTYYRGYVAHDGNATVANRIYYQCLADHVSDSTTNTLANTSLWVNAGQVGSQAFGRQPLRTGNWRPGHNVRSYGNVMNTSAGANAVPTPGTDNWYGETPGRNSAYEANWSDYFKTRVGGTLAAGATYADKILVKGDYRPKSIASGDAVDSPLLNRVPAGAAVCPFDLYGTTRLNDGTGAAGALERAA